MQAGGRCARLEMGYAPGAPADLPTGPFLKLPRSGGSRHRRPGPDGTWLTLSGGIDAPPGGLPRAVTGEAAEHSRLWARAGDLERPRAGVAGSNPLWRDGRAVLAKRATDDVDAGRVPAGDGGSDKYERYPSEMYAELFAFLSLVSADRATRDGYARRARCGGAEVEAAA